VLEVWTNGAVSPDDALTRAATFLRDHFSPLSPGGSDEDDEAEASAGDAYLREALGKTLEELALPARAINALKGAELHLVADLVQKTETDLADVKNLGDKSIDEIKTALAALGLSLGMRIDPNVPGRARPRHDDDRDARRRRAMRHRKDGYKLGRLTQHRWAMFRNLLGGPLPPRAHRDDRSQGQGGARSRRPRGDAGQAREPARAPAGAVAGARQRGGGPHLRRPSRRALLPSARAATRASSVACVRRGDAAPMVLLELVDRPDTPADGGKKGEKKEKAPRGEKGEAGAPGKKKKREKAAAAAG
jgi:hypothetical protein